MAGEGRAPGRGRVDDAEDGEVSLDGVQIGPPGAEATALLGWLSSAASAGTSARWRRRCRRGRRGLDASAI